jgi:hypothetical protein
MSKFSTISSQEQITFWWDDDVRFVLDQHTLLDLIILSARSLKQPFVGRCVAPLEHFILIQPV